MKSTKQMKAEQLTKMQDQLKDREDVAAIIRKELMQQLEGGSFWDQVREIVLSSKAKAAAPAPAPAAKPMLGRTAASKGPKAANLKGGRRQNAKMSKRGLLVRKLMQEEGMTLPQASKHIKDNNLI